MSEYKNERISALEMVPPLMPTDCPIEPALDGEIDIPQHITPVVAFRNLFLRGSLLVLSLSHRESTRVGFPLNTLTLRLGDDFNSREDYRAAEAGVKS